VLNPAGLSRVKDDFCFTLYTAKMSYDRKHNFIGAAKKVGTASIGLGWTNAGVDDIDQRSEADEFKGRFGSYEHAIALSFGYGVENVGFGAAAKILMQGVDLEGYERTTGFGGIDIGVLASSFSDTVHCGLAVKNLGGKVGDATVPIKLDVGVAFKLLKKHEATFAVDFEHEIVEVPESSTSIRLGAEYWLREVLAFRAGGQHSGDRRSLFVGFGVKVAGLQLDYAFKPTDDAEHQLDDNSHFVSLSYAD
jgi:hypothetical protein